MAQAVARKGILAALQIIVEASTEDLESLYIKLNSAYDRYDPCHIDDEFDCQRGRASEEEKADGSFGCYDSDDFDCPLINFNFDDFYADLQDRVIAEIHIRAGATRRH